MSYGRQRWIATAAILSTICYFTSINIKSAQAWGPELDYGVCKINTGKEVDTFRCWTEQGGGAGGSFINIYHSDSKSQIGVFTVNTETNPPSSKFVWSDGRNELVKGSKWLQTTWIFWTQRGWSVSFEKRDDPLD